MADDSFGPWRKQLSKSRNMYYWFDPVTNKSVWCDDSLPHGWGFKQTGPNAPLIYVNLATSVEQSTKPTTAVTTGVHATDSGPGSAVSRGTIAAADEAPSTSISAHASSAAATSVPSTSNLSLHASKTASDDLLSTPYIPDERSRGANVPRDKASKRDYLFNQTVPDDIKWKLQVDEVALYSITQGGQADKMTRIISEHLARAGVRPADAIITDATACVGGNTLSFARTFKKVNAVEISAQRAKMLQNNVDVCGLASAVSVINAEYTSSGCMSRLANHCVFMDPPWGGPEYLSAAGKLDMYLGAWDVRDIAVLLTGGSADSRVAAGAGVALPPGPALCRLVAIKAPVNYNVEGLEASLAAAGRGARIVHTETMHKMILLLVQPGPQVEFRLDAGMGSGAVANAGLQQQQQQTGASRKRGREDADDDVDGDGEHHNSEAMDGSGGARNRQQQGAGQRGASTASGAPSHSNNASAGGVASGADTTSTTDSRGDGNAATSSSPGPLGVAFEVLLPPTTAPSAVGTMNPSSFRPSGQYLVADRSGAVTLASQPEVFSVSLAGGGDGVRSSSAGPASADVYIRTAARGILRASGDKAKFACRGESGMAVGLPEVVTISAMGYVADVGGTASATGLPHLTMTTSQGTTVCLRRSGSSFVALQCNASPTGGLPPDCIPLCIRPLFNESLRPILLNAASAAGAGDEGTRLLYAALGVPSLSTGVKLGAGVRSEVYAVTPSSPPSSSRYPHPLALKVQPWDDRVGAEVEVLEEVAMHRSPAATDSPLMTPIAIYRDMSIHPSWAVSASSSTPAATGTCYILMRDHGKPVDSSSTPLPVLVADAMTVWRRTLEALVLLHGIGYIHCDMHAGNVLVTPLPASGGSGTGLALPSSTLVDLGSARRLTPATSQYHGESRGGRWDLMPPEQFGPQRWGAGPVTLHPSSDVYASAAMAVHLLTGTAPFAPTGGGKLTVDGCKGHPLRQPPAMRAHLERAVPQLSPSTLEVLLRCLDPEPARRHATAADVLAALQVPA